MEAELAELKKQVAALTRELSRVSDEAEVRKTHFKYGYYLDKCLYNEVVDMFSDHPDAYVEFLGSRYRGKEGIKRLYQGRFQQIFVKGRNGPVHGFLLDHPMMQDIVDVDATGTHAWVRMRALMSAGTHQSIEETYPRGHAQWWEGGVYENEYIKEGGVWRLFRYRYFPFWRVFHEAEQRRSPEAARWRSDPQGGVEPATLCQGCDGMGTLTKGPKKKTPPKNQHAEFERGWSHTKKNYIPWPTQTYPEDPFGPDEILEQKMLWPDTRVIPFHYPHPVTGRKIADDDLRAPLYGEDVSTADKPLTLQLPEGQRREGATEGVTQSEPGTKVLPELVQNKVASEGA